MLAHHETIPMWIALATAGVGLTVVWGRAVAYRVQDWWRRD